MAWLPCLSEAQIVNLFKPRNAKDLFDAFELGIPTPGHHQQILEF